MKTNVVLAGLMAVALSLHAEDSTAPADPAFNNPDAVPEQSYQVLDTDTELLVAQAESETPVAPEATETPAVVETEEAASVPANEPAADLQESAQVIIPLIVMDEVPLMDAIRNLARQAELNYMVDPRVPYGQMGPDGKVTPQPVLSIRWENVSAEQALVAVLNNYNLQLTADPKTQIQRLTVRDPAAPDPLITETIQLQYASPTNVLAAITASFTDKRGKVVPDTRTSQLVIVATEKDMIAVKDLVAKLDSPTKQVLIEARLVETTMNPSTIKGIDWSGTLEGQKLTFGNNRQLAPVDSMESEFAPLSTDWPRMIYSTMGGPATAFLNADGVSAVLSFINKNTESKVLSSPRTVTLDNDTAHIEVGTQYPVINVTAGTANTSGGSQISYSNLTVRLDVTPRISANNTINLRVAPQVMRLESVQRFISGDLDFDVPIFATRRLETSVMIPSGNTLVMGGLIQDNTTSGNTKVPLLGDIPGLGLLFRQDRKSREKGNLIVFITPTIVQDADFQPTPTDFLKSKFEDPDEKEWSAWDSGKPKDWSSRK